VVFVVDGEVRLGRYVLKAVSCFGFLVVGQIRGVLIERLCLWFFVLRSKVEGSGRYESQERKGGVKG